MIDRKHLAALLSVPSERNDELCELAAEARPPILGGSLSEHDVDGALEALSGATLDPAQRVALGVLWAALGELAKGGTE